MTKGYDGSNWIAYFLDDYSRMNHVYTQKTKTQDETVQTIKDFVALIQRRYNRKVKILHIDGETALGNDFDDWVKRKGIIIERSTPYTPSQNGSAERSGEVIIKKA